MRVHEHVLELEVPVDDEVAVEVVEREEELGGVEPGARLREGLGLAEMVEEGAARVEVGDEVEARLALEGEAEADDERVADLAEDGALQLISASLAFNSSSIEMHAVRSCCWRSTSRPVGDSMRASSHSSSHARRKLSRGQSM